MEMARSFQSQDSRFSPAAWTRPTSSVMATMLLGAIAMICRSRWSLVHQSSVEPRISSIASSASATFGSIASALRVASSASRTVRSSSSGRASSAWKLLTRPSAPQAFALSGRISTACLKALSGCSPKSSRRRDSSPRAINASNCGSDRG